VFRYAGTTLPCFLQASAAPNNLHHHQLNSKTHPAQKIHRQKHHPHFDQTDLRDLSICGNCFPSICRFFDSSPYRRIYQDKHIIASAVSVVDRTKTLPVSTPGVRYSCTQNNCALHPSTIVRMLRINTFSIYAESD
jgi:hypothetical protein